MNTRKLIVPLRLMSFVTTLCFSWSLILASTVHAAVESPPLPPGHSRLLSMQEMSKISGSVPAPGGDGGGSTSGGGGTTYVNPAATPGASYPWIGSVGGVSTYTGNKTTAIPIVSYSQHGTLPVALTLVHNSQSSRNGELGPKWLHSYDAAVIVDASGNPTVYWGDGSVCTFMKNVNGTYSAPPGVHDIVTVSGSGSQTQYRVTKKDQTYSVFNSGIGTNYYRLGGVADENNNYVVINYVSGTNRVSNIIDSAYRATTLGYTGTQLTSVTDPLNRHWTISYDGSGNLAHISWPVYNGGTYTVNLGYDGNHNVASFQDLRGYTSTFSYNADNTLAWEKDAIGNQTSFGYGTNATTVTDPNGHTATHTYNAAGQLASTTDALNYSEYYTYDTANNVTRKQDRRGYYWYASYDGMGNVLTSTPPGNSASTMTYNAHNRMLTAQAPSGRSVAVTYDGLDNPTQVQEKNASGTVLATTKFTIGSYGLVSDKYDPNNHHTAYTYDGNGYLASTTTPLGNVTRWTYDALGFQTSRKDAMGRTTTYTPDPWERLVTTTYPDNSTNQYVLDANSNLVSFGNYAGTWTRVYDADNRMTNEYYGGTRDITHTYDGPGQKGLLSSVTDFDGRVISYTYSARNELASVGDSTGTTSYAYDEGGNQSHLYNPNGTRTDQYYNPDSSLHNYYNWNGGSTIFSSYGYAYNADHQITGLNEGTSTNTDTMPGPTQSTYVYDGQGHLTSESRTGNSPYSTSYVVDGAGNRTNYYDGQNSPFTYDGDDEVKTIAGSTYGFGYNANGDRTSETISGQVTTFGYDFDDQLVSLTKPGTTEGFSYDAIGRQVNKSVNGVLTGYYFDGEQILEEKTGSGTLLVQYVWGNGLVRCNGEYPMTDGRGNVRQSTDGSQNITSANAPTAFGLSSVTGGTASAYSYGAGSGYRQDGVAPAGLPNSYALQKVGARYYDPAVGGFLTRDTDLSQSPYAYCDGDPVNCTDPSGHLSAVNIAAGPMQIMGVSGGAAEAPVDTTGDSTSNGGSSGGTMNLSGTAGLHTVKQGTTTTVTATGTATSGKTTFGGSVIFTFTPVHFATSGTASLGYNPSSTLSLKLIYTPPTHGQASKTEFDVDGKF